MTLRWLPALPIALCWAFSLPQLGRATSSCSQLPAASVPGFQAALESFLNDRCYQKENWQHDPKIRGTDGVHPNVKVWYSPSMWSWLTTGNRKGDAPAGGILIKEQFYKHTDELTDWSVMVRDDKGAWDGWWWGDLDNPDFHPSDSLPPLTSGEPTCTPAAYPSGGFGQYCINCHASAAKGQDTFATTRFVLGFPGPPLTNLPPEDDIHYRLSHHPKPPVGGPNNSACMVPESSDHVVAGPKPEGPHGFLTSDQCTACHNATGTISPAQADKPSMLYYLSGSPPYNNPKSVNLSAFGEWRFSMMGLAGRDPIFFSQLNSETTLHGNLKTEAGKPFVENLCLHCHGVMGQRQYEADTGRLFTRDKLQDSESPYGALARDGISCTVCHRMSADGLGKEETFTGNFHLDEPGVLNGPFANPLKLPMNNALGVKPRKAEQITESGLCGSCHAIDLPVFRANGEPVTAIKDGARKPKTFFEQATFLEWQNSQFADGGTMPKSCQDCHMPNTYEHDGTSSGTLAYKIANIEDSTFPAVDHRAPDAKIDLQPREDYRRHLLLGINVFALEMFKQFRAELGLYVPGEKTPTNPNPNPDPMIRQSLNVADGVDTAIDQGANFIAKTRTADVKIISVTRTADAWQVDVQVQNKAGHNFPSGVGFRRAFLQFETLDESGSVLWGSGRIAEAQDGDATSSFKGVLVDAAGRALPTEFFTPQQQRFQAHYWAQNPITREDQVQIYEELVTNPEGYLTTSFIALDNKVKDNRLQPQGWSSKGPSAEETGPVGTCVYKAGKQVCDPHYCDGSGASVVRYLVPLTRRTAVAQSFRATLYYQAIPPYYQLQRASDASGTDTDRLVRFVKDLKTAGTPVERWALPIGTDQVAVQ